MKIDYRSRIIKSKYLKRRKSDKYDIAWEPYREETNESCYICGQPVTESVEVNGVYEPLCSNCTEQAFTDGQIDSFDNGERAVFIPRSYWWMRKDQRRGRKC